MNAEVRLKPGKYRLTTSDFACLGEAGVFADGRTELLDGDIIVMNAEYRPHAWTVGEIGFRFRQALADVTKDLHVMSASIALSNHDMPLPDLVLTSEPRGTGPIPLPSVALVVEVSSSTLDRDLGAKVAIYARAGVPEYWVVDLNGRVIHQMWAPDGDAYGHCHQSAFGDPIATTTIAGLTIGTTGL